MSRQLIIRIIVAAYFIILSLPKIIFIIWLSLSYENICAACVSSYIITDQTAWDLLGIYFCRRNNSSSCGRDEIIHIKSFHHFTAATIELVVDKERKERKEKYETRTNIMSSTIINVNVDSLDFVAAADDYYDAGDDDDDV